MIKLTDVLSLPYMTDYKVHFARYNQEEKPLEVWLRSEAEWRSWQEYMPNRNDFNRKKIFSLMDFYHQDDLWLFGGIYEVKNRLDDRYQVELCDEGKQFIGRLKIHCSYRNRTARPKLENIIDQLEVAEILRERFSGRSFPGLENINITYRELMTIIDNNKQDWISPLKNLKGIYLITDDSDGRVYVGSAYGAEGIWSRWVSYIRTGDGGNVELKRLIKEKGIDHCIKHFRFALLEANLNKTPDDAIIARENYWKELFQSRSEKGLNKN